MYILGLSPSWGTSRICPAWSPSEHQLTPALSPIWGPCPKPRHPEEVVYSLNDSCSHFTQCLFPPKLPQQHTCTTFIIHSSSFMLIIHHICKSNYILLLHDKRAPSLLWFFVAGRLLSVSCVWYKSNILQHKQKQSNKIFVYCQEQKKNSNIVFPGPSHKNFEKYLVLWETLSPTMRSSSEGETQLTRLMCRVDRVM